MVPLSGVILGFIALMGLFTFGAADGERYQVKLVDTQAQIEQVEEPVVLPE